MRRRRREMKGERKGARRVRVRLWPGARVVPGLGGSRARAGAGLAASTSSARPFASVGTRARCDSPLLSRRPPELELPR